MDVFSSALKNPLPPARKKYDSNHDGQDTSPEQDNGPTYESSRSLPMIAQAPSKASEYSDSRQKIDSKRKNSRRRHRNSHLGCGICKKRRIKCDEHLPQCFNCIKGRLHCAYLNLDAPARNALRLAQYNQNLRDDRDDEPQDELSPKDGTHTPGKRPSKPLLYPSVMNPLTEPLSTYMGNAAKRNMFEARAISGAKSSQVPMVPPIPGPPQMMQSMYMPMMQLQPATPGTSYSQLPIQMIAGPHTTPVMYRTDQGPAPPQHAPALGMNGQPIMYFPAQAHGGTSLYDTHGAGSYMVPIQQQSGPAGLPHNLGPFHSQDAQKPEITVSAPKSNANHPEALLTVPHPTPSSSISPVTHINPISTPSVPSLLHPEGNYGSNNDQNNGTSLSTGLHLNSTSLGTSPLLPPIEGNFGEKSGGSNADTSIRLAPIQVKTEVEKHISGKRDFSPNENEKISSINMLLS